MSHYRLLQFQCQRDGTLFYYQTSERQMPFPALCCPVCRSSRTEETGRVFSPVDAERPVDLDAGAGRPVEGEL